MKIRLETDVQTTLLGKALLEKRGTRALRAVAAESGITVPTLNRVERGGKPDMDTFLAAMKWLKIPSSEWGRYVNMEVR